MPMLSRRAKDAEVRLLRKAAPALAARVRADERRLSQVIIKLVDNAIKFTTAGGRVSIGFAIAADGGLDIAVSDNGIGMSPEQIKAVFQAFERGSDPCGRASEGVGLGLALCSEIMRERKRCV